MSAIMAGNLGIDGVAASEQFFVINLCSSTSPMALSHPASPELKRYTFFVSRQRDEGRERFRLHMGYFATQAEAESLLATVRDVYPAAWAGPAPTSGVPRRGKIAPVKLAPEVAQATPVAVPAAVSAPASAEAEIEDLAFIETMTSVRSALAQLSEEDPITTVEPLSPVEELALLEKPAAKPAVPAPVAAAPPPPRAAAAAPTPAPRAPVAAPAQKPSAAVPKTAQPAAPAAKPTPAPAAARSVPAVPAPAVARSAPATPAPPAPPAARPLPVAAAKPAPPAVPAAAAEAAASPYAGLENEPEVRVVTPEDTQALRDIKLDAQNNAPPCFAVQLLWSASPIDVAGLPHLAIFDAYKLYNVEGNRQGRKWYGLRLGFFSDPNSATQVANYVRSDYRSVAVVPVANKERDHATGSGDGADRQAMPRLGTPGAPMKHATDVAAGREKLDGFELLVDDRPPPARRDIEAGPEAAAKRLPVLNPPSVKPMPGKATGKPTGKRVVARPRATAPLNRAAPGKANTLESTLEILGASTLSLADEGREILNDSAIREPEKKQGSKFSKLLGRLSGN